MREGIVEPTLSEKAVLDYYAKFRNSDEIRLH